MKKPNFTKLKTLALQGKDLAVKYSPELLTGVGAIGFISGTVMAVKATPKAMQAITVAEYQKSGEPNVAVALTKKETFKVAWKYYIPAVLTEVTALACIVYGSKINHSRQTALAAAYALSEAAAKKYKDKVTEVLGEKKEKKDISDPIVQDALDNHPASTAKVVRTKHGDTLCYDVWSDRYFTSDKNYLEHAINMFNNQLNEDRYLSLADLYSIMDIPKLGATKAAAAVGWNIDFGLVRPKFSSCLNDKGEPCLTLDFYNAPTAVFMDR